QFDRGPAQLLDTLAERDRVGRRRGQRLVLLGQLAQVLLPELPDLGERRQRAGQKLAVPHDRTQQPLGVGRLRLVLERDEILLEAADPEDLFLARPGRLVASRLDPGQVGPRLLDVDELVDAAERAALDAALERAGTDSDPRPDAEAVDRRA